MLYEFNCPLSGANNPRLYIKNRAVFSRLGILILTLVLISCQATQKSVMSSDTSVPFYISKFIEKQNIQNINFIANESGSRILCWHSNLGQNDTNYAVYDLLEKKEIFSSGFIGKDVKWLNNDELVITGTSRVVINSVIVINVVTGKSRSESNISKKLKTNKTQ